MSSPLRRQFMRALGHDLQVLKHEQAQQRHQRKMHERLLRKADMHVNEPLHATMQRFVEHRRDVRQVDIKDAEDVKLGVVSTNLYERFRRFLPAASLAAESHQ